MQYKRLMLPFSLTLQLLPNILFIIVIACHVMGIQYVLKLFNQAMTPRVITLR
jgi:hypothetical protein